MIRQKCAGFFTSTHFFISGKQEVHVIRIMDLSQTVVLALMLVVIVVWWRSQPKISKFTIGTPEQWDNEVLGLYGFISPYLSEVYVYLRSKYADQLHDKPLYLPKSGDVMLQDSELITVRAQLKAWIDSWTLFMRQQYSVAFVQENMKRHSFSYTDNTDGTLTLQYKQDDNILQFLV